MGVLDKLVGGSVAEPINAIGNVLDKLFTSKEEKLDKAIIMERLRQQPALAQVELNKIEAQHRTIFVAGWRPFIGWVCGVGIAQEFIFNPNLEWILERAGPEMDLQHLIPLVLAMLGLGYMRTAEKQSGVAK